MTGQLPLTSDDTLIASPNHRALSARQQLAFDYVRAHDGVTADEVGASLHTHRDRRPHGVDDRCEWCSRDGRAVLTSKALKPLVRYRLDKQHGRLYIARNPEDRLRDPDPGPAVCATCNGSLTVNGAPCPECHGNPFYGLDGASNTFEHHPGDG